MQNPQHIEQVKTAMEMPKARTTPSLIAEMAKDFPNYEALVDESSRFTFSELWEEVRLVARGLMAIGVKAEDHVAILMGNRSEWVICDLAISTIGATMVSVSTYVTAKELKFILNHSDADFLIYERSFLKSDYAALIGQLEPLFDSVPKLKNLIGLGEGLRDGSLRYSDVRQRASEVSDEDLNKRFADVSPDSIAALLYTSGSTSTPKGVQIAHGDAIENMWHIGERMHIQPGDRFWCAVSMFWGLGSMNILYNAYTHASCIVLQRAFDASVGLRLIESEKCSIIYAFPNMIGALIDCPDYNARDLTSLRGGASVGTPEQMRRVMAMGATDICQIYGLTETYGNCAVIDAREDPMEKRLTSCGRPLPGAEIKVVDPDTLEERPVGEIGEFLVRKRVMPGYYKDDDKNAEAFLSDGYFRTGDLGRFDEDGFLYFEGRSKDMIKVGGINVSPAEVEREILQQQGVAAAYVVGVPDPIKDEIVGALVIPDRTVDSEWLEVSLRAHMKAAMSNYKRPAVYKFITEAELPQTVTGKLKRNEFFRLFEK